MENFTPTLRIVQVMWKFAGTEWVKYNTYEVARGNPKPISYDFSMRDDK